MGKYFLLPSYKQFKSWSLPSKATLVSLWIGLFSLLITLVTTFSPGIFSQSNKVQRFYSINDMRKSLEGFGSEYINLTSEIKNLVDAEHEKIGGDAANGEWSYSYEISILGQNNYGVDLNSDGIPEIVVDVGLYCMGSGGCTSPIYSFDNETKKFSKIGQINTRNYEISDIKVNGWLIFHDYWKLGVCERIKSTYYYKDNFYKIETQKTINIC